MTVRRFIPLALTLLLRGLAAYAGPGDRGLVSLDAAPVPFVQRGDFMAGGSLGGARRQSVDGSVAVVKDVDFHNYSFFVSPSFMYGIGNDSAVGISLDYRRSMFDLLSAGIDIEGIGVDVNDYCTLSHRLGAFAFYRKYLCIGGSGRIALYVDTGFRCSVEQGRISSLQGDETVGSFESGVSFGFGVNPGLAAYLRPGLVLAAGLGLGAVDWKLSSQIHNQVDHGNCSGLSVSYAVDLLSLSVGLYHAF